jgi:hypothetical protein
MICLKNYLHKDPSRTLDAIINNKILYGRYNLLIDKSKIYTGLYLKVRPINMLRTLINNEMDKRI